MRPRPTHLVINCGIWECGEFHRWFSTIRSAALNITPNVIFKATTFFDHGRNPMANGTQWFQELTAPERALDRVVCARFTVGTRKFDLARLRTVRRTVKYGSGFFFFPFPAPKVLRSSAWVDYSHFESVTYRDWNQGLWSLITSLPAPSQTEEVERNSSLAMFGPLRSMELQQPPPRQELRTLGLDNISWVEGSNSAAGKQQQRVDLDLIFIGGKVTRDLFLSLVYRLRSRGRIPPRDLFTINMSTQAGSDELVRHFHLSLTSTLGDHATTRVEEGGSKEGGAASSILRCHVIAVKKGKPVQNCYSTFLEGRIRLSFYLINKRRQMSYSAEQRKSAFDSTTSARTETRDESAATTTGGFLPVIRELLAAETPFISHLLVGLDFSITSYNYLPVARFEPDAVFQSLVLDAFKPSYNILWLECPPPNMIGEQGEINGVPRPLDWIWSENYQAVQNTARELDSRFKFHFCLQFRNLSSPCEFVPFPVPSIRPEPDFMLLGEEKDVRGVVARRKRDVVRFEPRVYHEWATDVWTAVLGVLPVEGESGFYKKW